MLAISAIESKMLKGMRRVTGIFRVFNWPWFEMSIDDRPSRAVRCQRAVNRLNHSSSLGHELSFALVLENAAVSRNLSRLGAIK